MIATAFLLIAMTLVLELPVNHAYPGLKSAEDQWPEECNGKSYCHIRPLNYPNETINKLMANVSMNYTLGDDAPRDRDGGDLDVASCRKYHGVRKIYLIKDKNDEIRYVTQTEKFQVKIVVEECRDPGTVTKAQGLIKKELKNKKRHRVDCVEELVPFAFPVLSRDWETLEAEAPKNGISLSCSAKVMQLT